jgi:hypothetical protein
MVPSAPLRQEKPHQLGTMDSAEVICAQGLSLWAIGRQKAKQRPNAELRAVAGDQGVQLIPPGSIAARAGDSQDRRPTSDFGQPNRSPDRGVSGHPRLWHGSESQCDCADSANDLNLGFALCPWQSGAPIVAGKKREHYATTMFARFRQSPNRLQVSLVETSRANGPVRSAQCPASGAPSHPCRADRRKRAPHGPRFWVTAATGRPQRLAGVGSMVDASWSGSRSYFARYPAPCRNLRSPIAGSKLLDRHITKPAAEKELSCLLPQQEVDVRRAGEDFREIPDVPWRKLEK